ncbi:cobalt-precorrin-5B (C(1))-methyltransferase CbiD [Anaerolentibacter hominis]|uniref:cobalt-precorrin-5B (C(1))-methyltransferase CbiD n=1 Tax=Anaerolentibacter hominis TaxID=3079009 RepID=UPI0031B7F026
MQERYITKNHRKLRYGYTTGSCAAAAAKAAVLLLLSGERVPSVTLTAPKGDILTLPVHSWERGEGYAVCSVIKDAGDDADVTDGMAICARAEKSRVGVSIEGGEGIGRVTRKGLDQPVGAAAINSVPRQMIRRETEAACEEAGYDAGISILIFAPEGKNRSGKTFNPRLGIEGGISILGTSGIVEPMSERAIIDTILTELRVLAAGQVKCAVLTPGNYGEEYLRMTLGLDPGTWVKCSNFIGEAVDGACDTGFEQILLVGHIGKLCKLACGIMNTHSRMADGRMEALTCAALLAGADCGLLKELYASVTTDEALARIKEKGMLPSVMEQLLSKIDFHLRQRAGEVPAGVILFSKEHGTLGMTAKAEQILKEIGERERI